MKNEELKILTAGLTPISRSRRFFGFGTLAACLSAAGFTLMFFFPLAAVVIAPLMLPLLAFIRFQFSAVAVYAALAAFTALAAVFTADILLLAFCAFLIAGTAGLNLALKRKGYRAALTLFAAALVLGSFAGLAAANIVSGEKNAGYAAKSYIIEHKNNAVINLLGRLVYFSGNSDEEVAAKGSGAGVVAEYFGEEVRQIYAPSLTFYVTGYCVLTAGLYLLANFLLRRYSVNIRAGTRLNMQYAEAGELCLPRGYAWLTIPAAAAVYALALLTGNEAIGATAPAAAFGLCVVPFAADFFALIFLFAGGLRSGAAEKAIKATAAVFASVSLIIWPLIYFWAMLGIGAAMFGLRRRIGGEDRGEEIKNEK